MGEIAPEEQFLPLSTIFYDLMLDFYVKTGVRFSLRDKRLFEITEVEITRVDCNLIINNETPSLIGPDLAVRKVVLIKECYSIFVLPPATHVIEN